MGRPYSVEIAELGSSYEWARALEIQALHDALLPERRIPMLFVGSGGSAAVARFAADLYQRATRLIARPLTPLEFVSQPSPLGAGAVLFTASGRHSDAAAVLRVLRAYDHAAAVCNNASAQFHAACASANVRVVDLGNPSGKDGFLATNSLLVTATGVARVFASSPAPDTLAALRSRPGIATLSEEYDDFLVLYPPRLAVVAADLEARIAETGLATVQVVDYRNFAHGRHYGLERRADHVGVVALIDDELRPLAERTLGLFPPNIHVTRLESRESPPWDAIDLLCASMKALGDYAAARGVDPGRPRVPAFGRKLYRLTTKTAPLTTPQRSVVDAKLHDFSAAAASASVRSAYEESFDTWLSSFRKQRFEAVVMDYDGTVCTTAGRYALPTSDVQRAISRLLDAEIQIGFASGRGDSLYEDLRQWVPKSHWGRVHLALYNGAVLLTLESGFPEQSAQDPTVAAAAARLQDIQHGLRVRDRHYQIQVSSDDPQWPTNIVAEIVHAAMVRQPTLAVQTVVSAHSVDVIPATSTKTAILDRVSGHRSGALAIGDQGHLGGNDFALLSAHSWTLSVDRCSADPTRCWKLRPDQSGPQLLVAYLAALAPTTRGLAFRWGRR